MVDYLRMEPGKRRNRGPESAARVDALERLKVIRRCGRRSGSGDRYDVKMENPIYDTIPEEEYNSLVLRRRDEAREFIVDDNELGYRDEVNEEDWSCMGIPPSSDESDCSEPSKRGRKKIQKADEVVRKKANSSLAAAAAIPGTQKISALFTSSVFRNKDSGKLKCLDSEVIVDDVIAEFAPDEFDRKRRRRRQHVSNNILPIDSERKDDGNPNFSVSDINNCSFIQMDNCDNSCPKELDVGVEEHALEQADDLKTDGDGVKEVVDDASNADIVVKEARYTLNAKINTKLRDPTLSATTKWLEIRKDRNENVAANDIEEFKTSSSDGVKSEFELDDDGSLPFYILDAHEEVVRGASTGTIYLFGKVKLESKYHSCCVVVKNMLRCVYAVPNGFIFNNDELITTEKKVEESCMSVTDFRKVLQDMAFDLKNEIANHLLALDISKFSMTPVKRRYAFERSDIPVGESYALKISYPFRDPPLPADLNGKTFCCLLGTLSSALELFLIKRNVKGPSWLSISKFYSISQKVSWCKFEIAVDSPKNIHVFASSKHAMEIPTVVVTSINLKTIINEKENANEIVSASVICCHRARIDGPMVPSEWKKPGVMSHFTVVRKLHGWAFPMGFHKEATERNAKAGSSVLGIENSERALINRLMTTLHKLDTDVLVGHNISGFDLHVLLQRAHGFKVPGWSKIGRLNRVEMPKLSNSSSTFFGSGASPALMTCTAGRLLCDTYLCARDLLKEASYSLTQLAWSRLNKDRKEVAPEEILRMFETSKSLFDLIDHGETDAWLALELMFHMSVLPLTRQLTNISGNLWGRTLQGARAQRVEYLLLHAFHARKFMVPDKDRPVLKDAHQAKRKMKSSCEDKKMEEMDLTDCFEDDILEKAPQKAKKGAAYAGGLVLEPKKGLFDKFVILLDFNSLYPSIIQEYNICFTTVEKSADGLAPRLPSSRTTGVLPELLKNLVERRRKVKSWMKTASDLKMQQLDIQQQALKLTANSLYGCLGFSNSRFYAKHLAELVTLQGREILRSTVDLVQNNLNLEVIYGDTDSIMIYTGLDDTLKAKAIAAKVAQEVNKRYRCLEIDLDGLYKRMLLLKKKKYAAVKLQFKEGVPYEAIERKGLDMVRRDWSLLSKELGDFCLAQILSGGSCEEVVEAIHDSLVKIQEDMRNGQVALEKYIIAKTLTKPLEAYLDARNQPHVVVALWLRQNGYASGFAVGDTIPYIVCCEQGAGSGSPKGVAQRARHPDELKKDEGKWMVDVEYYLSQQIHPVVSRLCSSIQGTSPERLAGCLGLDSSKFQSKLIDSPSNHASFTCDMTDDGRYRACDPLILSCPCCDGTFECPDNFSFFHAPMLEMPANSQTGPSASNFWFGMQCAKCPADNVGRISAAVIANQAKMQAARFVSLYYKGFMMCDDETCRHTARILHLRLLGDCEGGTVCPNYPRCNGHLLRKYTEADLYRQLSYFCHLLDADRCIRNVDASSRVLQEQLVKIQPNAVLAFSAVRKMRDRCGYGWVQMTDLTVSV